MKICLVIHSLQAGGMERVMSELAHCFSKRSDVELHLILYGIKRDIFYSVPDNMIIHKPSFSFNNRIRTLSLIRTMSYLRRQIKNLQPDSILSFGEYWNNFFLLSTLGLEYKRFVSDRSQPDKSLGNLHDYLRKWLYPTATGIILQTQKAKAIFLKDKSHKNISIIGNPIRTIDYESASVKREKMVIMVGRLIKSKHQDRLIKIFANINRPDWKLMLVGYDHLKQNNMDRLKQLAVDLHIEDKVIFTGKQSNIDELYCRSSIFAFTSSSEGFPNVIGEAMSAGLPVISYDCNAGPSDMIEDGDNGYLIPLFDDELFAAKLEQLMNSHILREQMGQKGREKIKAFSKEYICEQFYQFISN
ncbi:glycosyltransferase family 4 protein [Carboxylicivirga caseinilyticus]|uniref:glycosyltransferase family 4 protein n=1 Tax=Carboxylicivirga caseinilyticus TaxID=3417572 RepID=UPI003D336BED|nr:glycosyltransferase family 4 protein [Marinilabiliaceae bacterium A049]